MGALHCVEYGPDRGNARVVAVATGSDSVGALRAEGADAVLPDLRDTQAVVKAVSQAIDA
jgi:uncharacterized protein YbjT (DUF2867 family)